MPDTILGIGDSLTNNNNKCSYPHGFNCIEPIHQSTPIKIEWLLRAKHCARISIQMQIQIPANSDYIDDVYQALLKNE